MSNNQQSATARALLAFVELCKSEEREFITTMNLLLLASPRRRREIVEQIKKDVFRDGRKARISHQSGH
ncbi:hypothetical protein SAMN05443245_3578 [Paraburkholderia fungorum]|uniref:Uncharacterized protein n=1 Tax=Paraburkholderia fungorum TaxID=134537 RepID=A0A1H1H6F0_9BURK|nr:hypothetical protein SAMN05443245_3578 [Paraburkholderia fungorum]